MVKYSQTSSMVLVFGFVFLFMACHSKQRMLKRRTALLAVQGAELVVQENVCDTIHWEPPKQVDSSPIVIKEDLLLPEYCIIMGSFVEKENAENLRQYLVKQGFVGASIMSNKEGMFRVCATCSGSHEDAWQELYRIRGQYPQYRTAWMLTSVK